MPRRPGERVMPSCRFAPLAAILVSVALLFTSNAWFGKAGAGQEPTDKPALPVPRTITLQEDRISLSKALEVLGVPDPVELPVEMPLALYGSVCEAVHRAYVSTRAVPLT